jgi:hypothetical protein
MNKKHKKQMIGTIAGVSTVLVAGGVTTGVLLSMPKLPSTVSIK